MLEGANVILGNNLAGESVWLELAPSPVDTPSPIPVTNADDGAKVASCVVTCSC